MSLRARGLVSPLELRRPAARLVYGLCLVGAVLLALIMFYPLFWVLTGALKDSDEIVRVPPTILPHAYHWINFVTAWTVYEIPSKVLNTLIVYAGALAVRLIVLTLAAYSLSHLQVPFRRTLYFVFLATLMLPSVAYLVPSFLVVYRLPIVGLKLINTYWSIWLPSGADSFSLLLMKGFFDGIPKELVQASRIDGASEARIVASVILPLSTPIIAVVAILTFLGIWNDFLWQHLVLVSPERWTISVMLWFRSMAIGATQPMNVQLAAMFLSVLPPLGLFLAFQRAIVEGVTLSGLKG